MFASDERERLVSIILPVIPVSWTSNLDLIALANRSGRDGSVLYRVGFLLALMPAVLLADEVRIPGRTAYFAPDPESGRMGREGINGWGDPQQEIAWFGEFKTTGTVKAGLEVKLTGDVPVDLSLQIGDETRKAHVDAGNGTQREIAFGEFTIAKTGYVPIVLRSVGNPRTGVDRIQTLILEGEPATTAHFNLKPRRNAASVHLAYPTPKDAKVEWFYNEVTAVDDPVTTFYMAFGFHRGYFGMQVNSETERRIIFSVWDAGNGATADKRDEVAAENRVSLVGKGEGVHTSDFGNEGTGGHSHLKYLWRTGEPQRFLLTAKPVDGEKTIYSGYYFHPDQQAWMLISSMQAPRDGSYLRGLHSFSENFSGSTGHLRRKALFGPQWIRTADATWTELTRATFSHDATGKKDRLDRFMGVENGKFFLSHGGFVNGYSEYGTPFDRPASGTAPTIALP